MNDNISRDWSKEVFEALLKWDVSMAAYIPDAGNKEIIRFAENHNSMKTILLTFTQPTKRVLAIMLF